MKKIISVLVIVVLVGIVYFLLTSKKDKTPQEKAQNVINEKKEQKEKEQINSKAVNFIKGKLYNLCELFPKEKIEELSEKSILNTEFKPHKEVSFSQYLCRYYQEEAKYGEVSKVNIAKHIAIGLVIGKKQIKRTEEGYKMLNYTTKKDTNIPFNHLLVFDEKGKFHHLDLLLSEDYKLTIETWWSLLSSDEALNFVKKFSLYFKDLVENKTEQSQKQKDILTPSNSSTSANQTVPLPQDEDIIRDFVFKIEEGKADEAAKMMKINEQNSDQANSELQAWAVQFSNITSFKLLKMEKANESEWTDTKHIYKVVLDVWMDPRSANAPIPYYGWQNGENIRWLTLEKVGDTWKIAEIATGL